MREAEREITLEGRRRVLVVVAHPDDETLGAGGLIHLAGRSGIQLTVLVATDGDASHPSSPTHSPAELARRRGQELATAVALLAPSARLERLALPDGQLTDRENEVTAAVTARSADVDLVVSTWVRDEHPDHEAVGRAVLAGAPGIEVWQAPIWARQLEALDDERWAGTELMRLRLDQDARGAKTAALAAHVSQVAPLSGQPGDEQLLDTAMLERFGHHDELFVRFGAQR